MRPPRSLQWRVALAYTVLILVSLGGVSFYLVGAVNSSYIANLEDRLEQEAGLVGEAAAQHLGPSPDTAQLQALSRRMGELADARITIIAPDGTVLADTWESAGFMENHGSRPEVRQALTGGVGRSTRVSATVGQEMRYSAVPIWRDGELIGVARVAVPASQGQVGLNGIIGTIALAALIVALLSIALGFLLARRTSRSVRSVTEGARRLASGDLEHRVRALAPDETQDLAAAFNSMAGTLKGVIDNLSGERSKLSAVLDTMADGVVVIGPDDGATLLNPAARGLLGVTEHEGDGRRIVEGMEGAWTRERDGMSLRWNWMYPEVRRLVLECKERRTQRQAEIELLRPRRILSAIATPLGDSGYSGVLLTLHDLTRIRQMEASHKEFISNVSHELRNPLASIKAMVETLEDGAMEDPAAARDFLERIRGDTDRMSRLVNDLLELSRLESGQVPLNAQSMDLPPLVEEVLARFAELAESRGVRLKCHLPGAIPRVLGDREKLRQVLVNLLENSLKFTPAGGSVRVSAVADEDLVRCAVVDTGLGIAREHLPHIFERFYKVDRARRDGGTGLGLAIVKRIVEDHGGEVMAESLEGEGSTFTFTLPVAP